MRQDEQKAEEESTENESRDEPSYYGICVNKTNSEKCTNYSFSCKVVILESYAEGEEMRFRFHHVKKETEIKRRNMLNTSLSS